MNDDSRGAQAPNPSILHVAFPARPMTSERLSSMCQNAVASIVSRLALSRPLAVLDLETTGVSVERDRIVQVGIVRVEPSGDCAEFDRLVNPEMPISVEATAVHGITDAMVAGAPTFETLAPEVSRFLTGCDLSGYNVRRFDRKLLEAEYARVGAACPLAGAKVVDPFQIFVQREARTLAGAMRFYCGVRDFEGHNATDDVKATLCVLAGQLAKYPDLPGSVEGLDAVCDQRDPAWIDPDGKIAFKNGEACITFGKHAGRRLRDLVRTDPDYLRWVIAKDFSPAVKAVVSGALSGRFPIDVASRPIAHNSAPAETSTVQPRAAIRVSQVEDGTPGDLTGPESEEASWLEVDEVCSGEFEESDSSDIDDD